MVKLGKQNVEPNYLSRVGTKEFGGSLDDQFLDSNFFKIKFVLGYLKYMAIFLIKQVAAQGYFAT
jgi:hypothetical protein